MTALDQVANFVKVVVSTGYGSADTSITLATGQGSKLPSPASVQYNLVWWNATDYIDPADDPAVEIVRVTALSGDVLTVTRAQEGTSASLKNGPSKIYKMMLALTAKMISDIASNFSGTQQFKTIAVTGTIPGTSFTAASTHAGSSIIINNNTTFIEGTDYTSSGTTITWLYTLPAGYSSPMTLITIG